MRFWWVNQNQTYRHEVPGGYLADLRAERSNGKALEEGLSESYLPSHFACSRTAGRAGSLASQSSQRA
jgi:hypothetical protein